MGAVPEVFKKCMYMNVCMEYKRLKDGICLFMGKINVMGRDKTKRSL